MKILKTIMKNFPLRKIFTILGLFQFKYNNTTQSLIISRILVIYSSIIVTTIQSFVAIRLITNLKSNDSPIYTGFNDSWMGKVVVTLDHVFQMLVNCIGPILILIKRSDFLNFLKHLDEFEQNYLSSSSNFDITKQNTKVKYLIFACLSIFAVSITISFICIGNFSIILIISVFVMMSHFIFTQLYELTVFEKLRYNFVSLEEVFCVLPLTKWLELHMSLWELSQEGSQLFAFIRIVLLISANALISLMWFYSFGHVVNFLLSAIWQLIILSILVMCYAWHRVGSEVSECNSGINRK